MHANGGLFGKIKNILNEREESTSFTPQVSGLRCIENWVDNEYGSEIIKLIDDRKWEQILIRRTQHYGEKFDYLKRKNFLSTLNLYEKDKEIEEIPNFLRILSKRLFDDGIFPVIPNQITINECMPGQGIGPHTDDKSIYSDTVASLSLGSNCIFIIKDKNRKSLPILIKPNSLIVLKNRARYECDHGVRGQVYDIVDGVKVSRTRRISITFRKSIL